MNVALVYSEPKYGGITKHIEQLLQQMQGSDIVYTLAVSTNSNKIKKALLSLSAYQDIFFYKYSLFFSVEAIWGLCKLIDKNKIDVLHIHNLQTIFWGMLCKIFKPHVKIAFTPQVLRTSSTIKTYLMTICLKLLKAMPVNYIAVSESQREKAVKIGIARRDHIHYISNIMEPNSTTKNKNKKNNKFTNNAVKITQIGRLEKQKNHQLLLEAASLVVDSGKDVEIQIVGEGTEKAKLTGTIMDASLNEHVRMPGFIYNVNEILEKSDIITSTSLWEGMPYSILEALSVGLPIVSYKYEGSEELVIDGFNGFLVNNEIEMFEKICVLVDDTVKRKKFGDNSRLLLERKIKQTNPRHDLELVYKRSLQM